MAKQREAGHFISSINFTLKCFASNNCAGIILGALNGELLKYDASIIDKAYYSIDGCFLHVKIEILFCRICVTAVLSRQCSQPITTAHLLNSPTSLAVCFLLSPPPSFPVIFLGNVGIDSPTPLSFF